MVKGKQTAGCGFRVKVVFCPETTNFLFINTVHFLLCCVRMFYSLEKVFGSGAQPQLLVDLLVELASLVLELAATCRHARVRTL